MKHIFSSIDIGSDTVKIVVCELYNNKLHLLAASSVSSKGIKRGMIVNADEASKSIKEAFEKEMACYCDCDEPDEHPEYVESAYIEGVGQVNHHGWLCRKCKKYVQIG